MTAIGPKECPNADDVGAALHLLVQALDRVGAVQLGAMLAREGHAGQHDVLAAEDHQIRLPVPENLTLFDRIGSIADHATLWKNEASWLACVAGLPFASALGKVATESLGLSVFRIDVAVDRLLADPLAMTFVAQASSDLFRRPAVHQPLDHGQPQAVVPGQFALPRPTRCGHMLGIHVPVSRRHRHLGVVPETAPHLAVDGRTVATELDCDLRHADFTVQQARDNPAFLKCQMRGQERVSSICNSLKTMACRISK